MGKKRVWGFRIYCFVGLLAVLSLSIGCSFQEALVDGFYSGISDIVAALVSGAVL